MLDCTCLFGVFVVTFLFWLILVLVLKPKANKFDLKTFDRVPWPSLS